MLKEDIHVAHNERTRGYWLIRLDVRLFRFECLREPYLAGRSLIIDGKVSKETKIKFDNMTEQELETTGDAKVDKGATWP